MRATLPSMMGLQAFEAAARQLSFTAAALELCLSPGAVSRQVRLMEEQFGAFLFHRTATGLKLTPAGHDFLEHVRPGLDLIAGAADTMRRHVEARQSLRIAVLPGFGTKWLMPRYGSFTQQHPNITVSFFTSIELVSFTDGEAFDAAIHFGEVGPSGYAADWLLDEEPVTVCHPTLCHEAGLPLSEALAHYRLLQHVHRPSSWQDWIAAAGGAAIDPHAGPRLELLSLMVEAVRAKLGLALLPRFMVRDELASGEFIEPFTSGRYEGWSYWLVHPNRMPASPVLGYFREWILQQTRLVT